MAETETATSDDAAQAEDARAAAALRHQRAGRRGTIIAPASADMPGAAPLSDRPADLVAQSPAPVEDAELSPIESYHRGRLAGMARLADLSDLAATPDPPESAAEPKSAREALAAEWRKIAAAHYGYDVIDPFDMSLVAASKLPTSPTGGKVAPPQYANELPQRPDLFDQLFPYTPTDDLVNPEFGRSRREVARALFGMTAELPINAVRFLSGNLPDDELPGFALDLLLAAIPPAAMAGKATKKVVTAAERQLVSRPGVLHEPPNIQPGRVKRDVEGRPISAPNIAGRVFESGEDTFLHPEDYASVINGLAKAYPKNPLAVKLKRLFGDPQTPDYPPFLGVGVHYHEGFPFRDMRPELNAAQADNIEKFGYEIGQVIDDIVGGISTKGLLPELKGVYNSLNNPRRSASGGVSQNTSFTPHDAGFSGDDVRRVYIAEAIRAYLMSPLYIKTVAPKTAAAIRAAINEHPHLSRVIQFNAAAGLAGLPLLNANDSGDGKDDANATE